MLLCNAWRAFVNQQIAHRYVGVAQVGTEQRLTKVFHKLIPRRMALEKFAALMTRAIKRAVTLIDIIDQCAEERWAQLSFIMAGSGF